MNILRRENNEAWLINDLSIPRCKYIISIRFCKYVMKIVYKVFVFHSWKRLEESRCQRDQNKYKTIAWGIIYNL